MGKRKERKQKLRQFSPQLQRLLEQRSPQAQAGHRNSERPRQDKAKGARIKLPGQPHVQRLVNEVLRTLQGQVPPEEAKESESWLDWGLDLVKQWGPKLLEAAPELIALL